MIKQRFFILLVVSMLLLAGCAANPANTTSNIDQGSYQTGATLSEGQSGVQDTGFSFVFTADNQPYGILFQGTATTGIINLQLVDQNGSLVWKSAPVSGPFRFDELIQGIPAGTYSLQIAWEGPAQATYNFYAVPGEAVRLVQVEAPALLGGAGMILVALAFYLYANRRRYGWAYLLLGGLAWIVTVALKFAWAIPFNTPIYNFLTGLFPGWVGDNLFNLYVGSLTGIFEVGLVWLVVRYTKLGKVPLAKALAFGIGFGALEALLLGTLNLVSVLAAMFTPGSLTAGQISAFAALNDPLMGLAPVLERFFVILVHLFCNLALFYAAAERKPAYFWLSFVFKTLLDGVASWAQFNGVSTSIAVLWGVEAAIAGFGLAGWYGIRWFKHRYPQEVVQKAVVETGVPTAE